MLLRKKIYQFGLTALVFACGSLFFANPVLAEDPPDPNVNNLVVEFNPSPLFSEDNFLPGDNAFGYATVSNNSGNPKPIAIEAINFVNDDLNTGGKFGDGLRLIIEEDLSSAECFNGTLTEFFDKGEFLLSDPNLLGDGESITYNFYVTFKENSGNDYQGKSLGFDVIIGFQGEEGISDGDGDGGGGLPLGLIIKNEEVVTVTDTTATIKWWTSYNATSQVVYCEADENCSLDLSDNAGAPPLYGYDYTTDEMHTPANLSGVTYREMIITGLASGTIYDYRCISHASPPTVSRSHTFTTLASADGGDGNNNNGDDTPLAPLREGNNSGTSGVSSRISGIVGAASDFVDSILKGKDKEDENKGDVAGTVDENNIEINGEEESEIASECGKYPEYLLWLIVLLLLMIMILLYYIYRNKKRTQRIDNA